MKTLYSRRFFILGAVIALLVGAVTVKLLADNTSGVASASHMPPEVRVESVSKGELAVLVSYSANIEPKQQVNVFPRVSSQVEKVLAEVGTVVKSGDVLLEMDKSAFKGQLTQAEAGKAAAEARLAAMRAGPRSESVEAAEAMRAAAQARFDAMQAGPRTEAVQAARAGASAAWQRVVDMESGGRPESVAAAEANLKAAEGRLAQLMAGATPEQIAIAETQVRIAKNQMYMSQAQADVYLSGGNFAGGQQKVPYTPIMKEAQTGISFEQVMLSEANLANMKAGPTPEQIEQQEAAVEAAHQAVSLAENPYTEAAINQARNLAAQADAQARLVANPYTEHDLAAAQAALDQASAQVRLAKSPYTEHDIAGARAAVDQANAAVEMARISLGQASVKAPYDGVIAQKLVSEGAVVNPQTPLFRLISKATEVVLTVDEARLPDIVAGQLATVTVTSYQGVSFPATVTNVSPSIDQKTRTFQVRLTPKDDAGKLRDGMFAQVNMMLLTGKTSLLVPNTAVGNDGLDSFVYLLDGSQVQRRVVTAGMTDGRRVQILSGISEGDLIVAADVSRLRDGDTVVTP